MNDDFKSLLGGQIKKVVKANQSKDYNRNANRVKRDVRYAQEQAQTVKNTDAPVAGDSIKSDEFIEFRHPGVQIGVIDKLAAGEHYPNEIIDLHGVNLLEAEIYIRETIATMDLPYMSCLKIIHGKGYSQAPSESGDMQARMKNFVAEYLVTHPRVLAYVSTPIEHGGAGALYVLIKKIS